MTSWIEKGLLMKKRLLYIQTACVGVLTALAILMGWHGKYVLAIVNIAVALAGILLIFETKSSLRDDLGRREP